MLQKTIAITSNTSWYLYNFRKNTITHLIKMGFKIITIAPYDDYTEKLVNLGTKHINLKISSRGINPLKELITLYHFHVIYKENKIDIILNFTPKNNIYSSLMGKFHKIKVINNIAGLGIIFSKKNLLNKFVTYLYKKSTADFVFFQNKDDYSLFKKNNLINEKNTQYDILPGSGVDIKNFTPIYKKEENEIIFILIARMLYEKGVTYYIDAAKIIKEKHGNNVSFHLLGPIIDNKQKDISLEKFTSLEKQGIIKYLGFTSNVSEYLKKADCVVLPSFYREGVPRSLLEAAAMGKPIITTNSVGCKEVVENGYNGFLCQAKSLEDLVYCIDSFIKLDYKEKILMGMNGRKKIENEFNESIVINKYVTAINSLLNISEK
ncbi:glycosyltransferase family 4 protein [Proteus hauseri]|uniref:glycosyltransferase family 4 protein n=1 Tax=Proteus hauseri TaxID=183417 RepID=UPI0032DA87B5